MGDAMEKGVFLSAEWRDLAMLNWRVDRDVVGPLVPQGTELDLWDGEAYLSVVGFLFLKARIMGVPVPFHGAFEEVNLRFYVRRKTGDGWRRGVVFVRELVPKFMVAFVARKLFNENYSACPMGHRIERTADGVVRAVLYNWQFDGSAGKVELIIDNRPLKLVDGSESQFIAEHYWGYARQRDGGTVEYRVAHPPWRVCEALSARLDCDVAHLYGDRFVGAMDGEPTSAFLADGSAVTVSHGVRIA